MADMPLKRLSRLLRLQRLTAAGLPPGEAATRLGVSVRTVQRDLAELAKRSALPRPSEDEVPVGNAALTPAECRELFLLADKVADHRIVPGFSLVGRASEKLKATLPPHVRDELAERNERVSFADPPLSLEERASAFLQACADALRLRRVLRVDYDSVFDQAAIDTDLRVYHLTFRHRSWYAIAHSDLHGEVRTFHLGRMLSTQLLPDRYEIPADFSVAGHFGDAWQMIRGAQAYDVRVRFSPLVARSVADVTWHATQEIRYQADGSLEFRCRVEGLKEIASWILGYGTQAEALEPPELRQVLSERAHVISRYYRPDEE